MTRQGVSLLGWVSAHSRLLSSNNLAIQGYLSRKNIFLPNLNAIIYCNKGAEDIKTHMDEFKEEMSSGQRLTDGDLLELHILIEQASHEILKHRPSVRYLIQYFLIHVAVI